MDPFIVGFLRATDAYCEAEGISRSHLATQVVNDNKFFSRLQRKGNVTTKTMTRFARLFAKRDIEVRSDMTALKSPDVGSSPERAA